jgi:PAS domain S-box-containing protein
MQPFTPALDDLKELVKSLDRRLRTLAVADGTCRAEDPIVLTPLLVELVGQADALIGGVQSIEDTCRRYRERFNSAPVGYLCTDPHGNIVEVNRAGGALFGPQPTPLHGTSLSEYVHAESHPALRSILSSLGRGEEVPPQEIALVRSDGAIVPIAVAASPLRDAAGRVLEYAWVFRDISEEKRLEAVLRESERRYTELTESISDIFVALDGDARVRYWNRAAASLSGLSREEVLGKSVFDVLPMLNAEEVIAFFGTMLQTRQPGTSECRFLFRDKEFFFEVRAYPTREGISVYIRDITARKQAEDALRRSEERYRAIVESQTEFIHRWLPDGTITFVNDAYCRYAGIRCEDLVGRRYTPTIPAEDQDLIRRTHAALTPDNPVVTIEHRVLMPDGEIRWQQWTDRALFDDQGTIVEFQSVGRDTTEAKRGEEALMLVNRKLNLLANVTRHDILNKLTVLLGYLDLATMQTDDPELLAYFRKGSDAVSDIQRYITFTAEYQDIGVASPQWHGVHAAFTQAIKSFDVSGLDVDIQVGTIDVYADPLILRVFLNLLDNSLRHGEKVTRVRLLCEEVDQGVCLVYEDDGIGIPYAKKERIFEHGFGRQTGFGLFLAREILAITGLSIRETGVPGEGARFEIVVPRGLYRCAEEIRSPCESPR